MTQQARQIERPAAVPAETPIATSTGPFRVAGLPGAERRILRKRLARPMKIVAKRALEDRTPAR